MNIRRPTNLLYANTATRHATASPLARTRKVRSRVPQETRKIGIFDISAHAGFLPELLEVVSRRQRKFKFYPIETPVPMGIGIIDKTWWSKARDKMSSEDLADLRQNIAAQEYFPFLKQVREAVDVDIIAGLFGPMLAFRDGEGSKQELHWNYFSLGVGKEVAISVFDIREYANTAGRPFEAAVALILLAQVFANVYGVQFHKQTKECLFDFCENRDDLVEVIRRGKLCAESQAAIPLEDRESVEKCLQAIREYQR